MFSFYLFILSDDIGNSSLPVQGQAETAQQQEAEKQLAKEKAERLAEQKRVSEKVERLGKESLSEQELTVWHGIKIMQFVLGLSGFMLLVAMIQIWRRFANQEL